MLFFSLLEKLNFFRFSNLTLFLSIIYAIIHSLVFEKVAGRRVLDHPEFDTYRFLSNNFHSRFDQNATDNVQSNLFAKFFDSITIMMMKNEMMVMMLSSILEIQMRNV